MGTPPPIWGRVFAPPGVRYFVLLMVAGAVFAALDLCAAGWPPAAVMGMFWIVALLWIGLGAYGVLSLLHAIAFNRSAFFYRETGLPVLRWLIPGAVLLGIAAMGIAGSPVFAFAMSRPALESLVARVQADPSFRAPHRVGRLEIGDVRRNADGSVEIPTDVGYGLLDAQGLLYSPTPPQPAEPRSIKHLSGCWYRYCDG